MEIEFKQIISESENGYEDSKVIRSTLFRVSQLRTSAILFSSDFTTLALSALLSIGLQELFLGKLIFSHIQIIAYIILSLCVYGALGLYPGFSISPVIELKKLTIASSIIFFVTSVDIFWFSDGELYSYLFLSIIWLVSLVLVPLGRSVTRSIGYRLRFIGEPSVIIGYGQIGKAVVRHMVDNKKIGLHPFAFLDVLCSTKKRNYEGLPILRLNDPEKLHKFSQLSGIKTGIVIQPECSSTLLKAASKFEQGGFQRMIFISEEQEIGGMGVKSLDLGTYSEFELKGNLIDKAGRFLKRVIDILLVLSGGLLIFPIIILIACIIKLDSKGSVFYGHPRIGKDKRKFKAWKFRTMVPNADQLLAEYLEKDPELMKEWQSSYKLRNDPRITRVGKILRKSSLDELPQIWNVLVGEMSLVGPRPIISEEIKCYGEVFDMYASVRPGITGLWQVSGRNDSGYQRRVILDQYYISNWSIWMDIYILARTIKVVLNRKGAY